MPTFSPPTVLQGSSDHFFGRYSIPVGQTVVKVNGVYTTTPYPWLGTLAPLVDGVDYFLGGHEYTVTNDIAAALERDGYTVIALGYGDGAYGFGLYGG